MNVTSKLNDQFQVSFEPAASTQSNEVLEKFHPPSTYKFPKHKFETLFSKSAIMCVCTISLSITSVALLKKTEVVPDSISEGCFLKIFLGGMPPDPPNLSMLCTISVT